MSEKSCVQNGQKIQCSKFKTSCFPKPSNKYTVDNMTNKLSSKNKSIKYSYFSKKNRSVTSLQPINNTSSVNTTTIEIKPQKLSCRRFMFSKK